MGVTITARVRLPRRDTPAGALRTGVIDRDEEQFGRPVGSFQLAAKNARQCHGAIGRSSDEIGFYVKRASPRGASPRIIAHASALRSSPRKNLPEVPS